MSRITIGLLASVLLLSLSAPVVAEYGRSGLISPVEAQRYGLDRAWFTQVKVDPARGRITNLSYFVSSKKSHTVYEVQYQDRSRNFSEHDLDRFGDELGIEGAEKYAKEFIEELELQEIESKLETIQIPEITLYAVTDRAMVHAIDGETGRTRWAVVIGRRDFPTLRAGVSEDYVAIINGTTLYLLKRATGEIAWSRRIMGVPSAGAAVTNKYVVVPTFSGSIELYEIEEIRTLPEIYKSNGKALIQPIVTALSVAWPTDRGFLYVAQSVKKGLRYRLEANDTIVSQASYFSPGKLLAASIDGYVYCVHETSGNEIWRFSTGEPISQTPIPIGDSVYVVTDKGSMFSIDQETGAEKWWKTGVKRFIAASEDRLYCLGTLDRLDILDAKTGTHMASMESNLLDIFYPNMQTDRIFVGTKTGMIQCLRETQRQWPLMHVSLEEEAEPDRPEIVQEGLDAGQPAAQPKQPKMDPFGSGAGGNLDPFGGGGGGAGAGGAGGGNVDPFGGGGAGGGAAGGASGGNTDPFGGGGAGGGAGGGNADPFGGGGAAGGGNADPFGG